MQKINKADVLKYKALQKAIEQNKLRIYVNYDKLNRAGSPVYNPWEVLLPILTPVLLGILLIVYVGVLFGLFFIIIMILLYIHYIKKKLYHFLIKRCKDKISSSLQDFEELWNYGGFVLVNAQDKKI